MAITSGPSGAINVRDVEYGFTVDDDGDAVTVQCRLHSLDTASITLIEDAPHRSTEDLETAGTPST
ncbi:MAG: hypothetical protein R2789_17930 [Microthrixaceae bacterium]